MCAIERGKGNEKEAQMLMGNTFSLLLITGAILTGIGLLFYRPILYAFGASDVTFPYAGAYIRIYLLGTVFVMIVLGMNNFLSAQGFGNMSYADGSSGSRVKHHSGSDFYLWLPSGRAGSGHRDGDFPVLFRAVGAEISDRKAGGSSSDPGRHDSEAAAGEENYFPGNRRLYDGFYQWAGAGGLQFHPPDLRRRSLCGCDDDPEFGTGNIQYADPGTE